MALSALVIAVGGCGAGGAGASGTGPTTDADGWPTAVIAGADTRIGPSGTPCSIPVSFDLPDGWTARKVAGGGASALAAHGVYPVCEVRRSDGAPGVLRIWAGRADRGAQGMLSLFTEDSRLIMKRKDSRKITVAGQPAWELWRESVAGDGKVYQHRAFAVAHDGVTALVEWGGTGLEAHQTGLPCYFLVRRSFEFGGGATV
jgi:hypothetical protein